MEGPREERQQPLIMKSESEAASEGRLTPPRRTKGHTREWPARTAAVFALRLEQKRFFHFIHFGVSLKLLLVSGLGPPYHNILLANLREYVIKLISLPCSFDDCSAGNSTHNLKIK